MSELLNQVTGEVWLALQRHAPAGWIMDYLEYAAEAVDRYGEDLPTFHEYLWFQVHCEREMPEWERQASGEYLRSLLHYLTWHGEPLDPPKPDDALSFDDVEAAGLDGTLRSM